MATLMTTQNNTDIVTVIKNIQHCEEIKQSFKMLQPISKGAQGNAVSTILVPDTMRSWTSIVNKDEVIAQLLLCNKLHLHQVWDMPCPYGPLKDYIGDYGIGSGAKDILDENFDPNVASSLPTVNYWLKHRVQQMAPPNLIKVDLSLTEYKDLIKSQCKSISLSLSGRHYRHYRVALTLDSISLVHATMMVIPFLLGFTPSRWQKAINIMLKKDPGSPKITQLCII
eukprot:7420146-Ditylum_brightwellii.AAC.1